MPPALYHALNRIAFDIFISRIRQWGYIRLSNNIQFDNRNDYIIVCKMWEHWHNNKQTT